MANRIKGITIEIGGDTTKLDKALSGTNKTLRDTQTQLKDVERLLKLDPGNTELLAQKQRLLAQSVEATSQKLDTLRKAAENADKALERGTGYQNAYDPLKQELDGVSASLRGLENNAESMRQKLTDGEISTAQYDKFTQKLEDTRKRANELEQAIEAVNKEFAGAKIDQKQYDALQRELIETERAAKDAETAFDRFGSASQEANNAAGKMGDGFTVTKGIVADLASRGIGFLAEKALEAVSAIWNLDEATEEYRESMALLSTAFETAGFDTDTATQAYRGFYEILGETDTATEAAQLLASLAESEKDVSKWVNIAAGVYGTFGDSLPIESLIEAANETAKTGEVTGALADALNWAKISEEDVSKQLSMMADESDRAQYLMGLLSHTYSDAADNFYENSQAMIEARDAQMEVDETTAALGQAVADLKNQLIDSFGPYLVELAKAGADAIRLIADAIELVGKGLDWLLDKIGGVIDWFKQLFGIGQEVESIDVTSGSSGGRITSVEARGGPGIFAYYDNIPALASGGLIPPNNPFLAVLGDNRSEPEVVSPVSTIEEAVARAMSSQPRNSGGIQSTRPLVVNLILDGQRFARAAVPYINAETTRAGVNIVKK